VGTTIHKINTPMNMSIDAVFTISNLLSFITYFLFMPRLSEALRMQRSEALHYYLITTLIYSLPDL
jgi:hypothetical protein